MIIVLTGGGTGGHLTPLVAVANKIKEKMGNEAEFLYIGSGARMEKQFMAESGIPAKHVLSGKMRRYFSFGNVVDLFKVPLGFLQCLWILLWKMPDVVFSKGGYVSLPVVMAAWIYRIPILLHESDAVPGTANQFLARFADRIAVGYPSAEEYFPLKKTAIVGNPIRFQVTEGNAAMLRRKLGFSESRKTILILGGSQGSRTINQAVMRILPELLKHCQVIHQTGDNNMEEVLREAGEHGFKANHEGYHPVAFMNANELRDAFALSDLVISRAGATFITEIAANGKPVILIPIEKSANDHQQMNAFALAKVGAAMVLEETNLGQHLLLEDVKRVLSDDELRSSMSSKIRTFYHPYAAEVIANSVIEIARS